MLNFTFTFKFKNIFYKLALALDSPYHEENMKKKHGKKYLKKKQKKQNKKTSKTKDVFHLRWTDLTIQKCIFFLFVTSPIRPTLKFSRLSCKISKIFKNFATCRQNKNVISKLLRIHELEDP